MTRLPSLALTALILLAATVPLRAQQSPASSVSFSVCNKGTVAVEVVAAEKNEPLLGIGKLYYNVRGHSVPPGKCAQVAFSTIGLPSYIGFGFYDVHGQWGSGTISHLPDFGVFSRYFHDHKVVTASDRPMCTRKNEYRYSADDLDPNCAGMTAANAPDATHGPFVPVTAALYLETDGQVCVDGQTQVPCEYYLNVSPSPSDRDLHAVRATSGGQDVVDNDSVGIHILRALAKAVLDYRQQKAQAAADSARHAADTVGAGQRLLEARAAAREQRQQQILAADAAGDPNVKVEAQMIRRDEADNKQRWAGTRQSPAAYDPQWMGQNMVIVGTVSRVEVDPNGYPKWVSIYFKESPDATVVVCSPYPDMFQERVGQNLSALVGKTLEAAGQVESPYCGQKKTSKASIRVVESKQWKVH